MNKLSANKRCTGCKVEFPRAEFYANSTVCRPCHRIKDSLRPDRSGKRRENNSPAAKAGKRRYARTHSDPIKTSARMAVRRAIDSGKLAVNSSCEECGESPRRSDGARAVQAHHDDYSKPLDVRWLCPKCHKTWHRNNDTALASRRELGGVA